MPCRSTLKRNRGRVGLRVSKPLSSASHENLKSTKNISFSCRSPLEAKKEAKMSCHNAFGTKWPSTRVQRIAPPCTGGPSYENLVAQGDICTQVAIRQTGYVRGRNRGPFGPCYGGFSFPPTNVTLIIEGMILDGAQHRPTRMKCVRAVICACHLGTNL